MASAPAFAAQRTFVASTGNDANPCTIVQPCRSFSVALAKTAWGGEIIVLDSGGYGPVVISQAVTITAPPGVYAGISVPAGVNGVTLSPPLLPGFRVALNGLTISGHFGDVGIHAVSLPGQGGIAIGIDHCDISSMLTGIAIAGNVTGKITQSRISYNLGWGIDVRDGANITIDQVDVSLNGLTPPWAGGIQFLSTTDASVTTGSVSRSIFSGDSVAISATAMAGVSGICELPRPATSSRRQAVAYSSRHRP